MEQRDRLAKLSNDRAADKTFNLEARRVKLLEKEAELDEASIFLPFLPWAKIVDPQKSLEKKKQAVDSANSDEESVETPLAMTALIGVVVLAQISLLLLLSFDPMTQTPSPF